MNFAADARSTCGARPAAAVPGERARSFVAWRRDAAATASRRALPAARARRPLPRRRVRAHARHAPPGVSVELRRSEVRAVELLGGGLAGRRRRRRGDATTTRSSWRSATRPSRRRPAGALAARGAARAGACSRSRAGSRPTRVPPASRVAVRGFALTFLDAALALTEGRGGAFERDEHPYRLRYVPGRPTTPALILPFSRSGPADARQARPGARGGHPGARGDRAGRAAREILALPDGSALRRRAAGDPRVDGARLPARAPAARGERLRAACERDAPRHGWTPPCHGGRRPPSCRRPARSSARSRSARGCAPPDLQWALGHTWRSLYPALVERLGGGGLPEREWPAFRRLAAQLERVAFGPPPVNAAKLLALIDAGRVDLAHVGGAQLVDARRGDVAAQRAAASGRRRRRRTRCSRRPARGAPTTACSSRRCVRRRGDAPDASPGRRGLRGRAGRGLRRARRTAHARPARRSAARPRTA